MCLISPGALRHAHCLDTWSEMPSLCGEECTPVVEMLAEANQKPEVIIKTTFC